ncbi:amino acid ABC transporter permease [Enterococcus xiangfangensis]|uniref:Amino acid ABC transporter permease n=1 Tax=Enterococcus xiangfangensis TaxID=1296537 RepID=A0ABU3F8R6_9ENTE|nr:amino acid ABC transporter permease [Enterococcus xiangfangensis]MDT2759063.1 amino acid ABC transporter permease [Enterococcus xiangfangensis]NBK07930.1 amino acid ABC transporter permease [Enterococcus asini]
MEQLFDIRLFFSSIPELLEFLPISLLITGVSMIFGLLLALVFALVRNTKIPVLSQIVTVLVSFVRGTPIIVQLYLTYNGIPLLLKYINMQYGTDLSVNDVPPLLFVFVTFAINEAAYNSETLRAAFGSVDRYQIEAAESLGMTFPQILRRVIIPEAATVAIPPLGNSLISLLKGTSLAFVAGVTEMTAQGKIISGSNFRYFEVYLALAVIYWVLTIIIELVIRFLEDRMMIKQPVNRSEKRKAIEVKENYSQGSEFF